MFRQVETYLATFLLSDSPDPHWHWKEGSDYIIDFKIKWYFWPLVVFVVILFILVGCLVVPFIIIKEKVEKLKKGIL